VIDFTWRTLSFDERIELNESRWARIASERSALALTTDRTSALDGGLDADEIDPHCWAAHLKTRVGFLR
jgi:hypothetical protein